MSQTNKKILQKPKKKVVHKTRSEQYVINMKYIGEELEFSKIAEMSRIDIIRALNWYNYMCETSDAKEYAITYFNSINRNDMAKIISDISDDLMINSIGWISRLITTGHIVPQEYVDGLISKTANLKQYIKPSKTNNVIKFERPQRVVDISNLTDEIDKIVFSNNPDWKSFKFYEYALSNQLSKSTIQAMRKYLSEMFEYYKLILVGKDDQLNEGYKQSKEWKRSIHHFYGVMLSDCDRLLDNVKKARKPRTKKTMTTEKILKNFKIQQQSNEFKLQSLPPSKILGASEVWCFDTKNKVLKVVRALDGGLTVERMTITNVDESKSFQKNIGMRSEKILPGILAGTKASVRKCFDEINRAQTAANPRSSETMIILRVF